MYCTENLNYVFPKMKLRDLVPNSYIQVSVTDRSWEYINCSQIHECGNWETEHNYSVFVNNLDCAVSLLRIHKSEPVIFIGLSQDLHLQCGVKTIVFYSVDIRSAYEQKISSQIRLMDGKEVFQYK